MLTIKQSISQCFQCFNFLSRTKNNNEVLKSASVKDTTEYKKVNSSENWDSNDWKEEDNLTLNIDTELTRTISNSKNVITSPSAISVPPTSNSLPQPKASSPSIQQNVLPPRSVNPVPIRKPIQPKEVPIEPEVPDVDYFEQYNLKPQTVAAKKVSRVVPSMVINTATSNVEKSSKLNMEIVEDDIGVWGDMDISINKVEKEKKVKEDKKKKLVAVMDDSIDIEII